MKTKTILLSAVFAVLATPASLVAAGDWESAPVAPADDETSEWWVNTWHPGDVVPTRTEYHFEGRLCIKKKDLDEVRWYELKKRFLEVEQAVCVSGVSLFTTAVLDAPGAESDRPTQLLREFHDCPMSARAAAVKGLRNGMEAEKSVREAIDACFRELQSPEGREAVDAAIGLLGTIAGSAAEALVLTSDFEQTGKIDPDKARAARDAADKLVRFLGSIAKKAGGASMRRNSETLGGIRFEKYGDSDVSGTEAKEGGPLFRKIPDSDADKIANVALTANDLFDGCLLYLASAPEEPLFAKRLGYNTNGTETAANPVFLAGSSDLSSLPDKMAAVKLTPYDYRVSQVFARETLNVNATLFDMRRRSVGEVWRADASLLNNFLHPDLEGRFEGFLFLKYADDEPQSLVNFPEAAGKVFQCRHVVMLPRFQGGRSRLSYREPDFHMDYNPDKQDAGVSLWIDKETGHVLKVEVRMDGNVSTLPNLALVKGFSLHDSSGKLHFRLSYEANPSKKNGNAFSGTEP